MTNASEVIANYEAGTDQDKLDVQDWLDGTQRLTDTVQGGTAASGASVVQVLADVPFPYVYRNSNTVYLRVNGSFIETSHGKFVPASECNQALWDSLKTAYAAGGATFTETSIGDFELTSMDADGCIYVGENGCHCIPYSELERIAGELGLS